MRVLYDLPIRKKFAVVLVPLLVIILCLDYFQVHDHYLDFMDSRRLSETILLGVEINHVVHEIQKERSISIGYLTSNGFDFNNQLQRQREVTDSTLGRFYEELGTVDVDQYFKEHLDDLELLRSGFSTIGSIRRRIDKLELEPWQIMNYFSDINEVGLNTVDRLINETRDKDIAQQVHALIYFLKSKERASIERAIGTQAFSSKEMNDDLYASFISLVSEQEAYLDAFLVIADEQSIETYNKIMSGHDLEEVERLRDVIHDRGQFGIDPQYWYQLSTNRINLLKTVEDVISERLLSKANNVANGALKSFWTFIFLDITFGVATIWLMSIVVTNLLKNVKLLENFTRRISKGDLSRKVKVKTRDEIGHYANTFNVMIDEINKSNGVLKKERDKAKFLYHNIYRVSLVVFENIQQGIFLLDRNFRMSRLYSKAMEKIFGIQKIAGENFSSFMRPLIIPRDLEALEMFMKHLFNEDMDEDVVNQLNPIEQVKIYSETDGVVSTKYIRVNFTRVWRQNRIINIMVSISDETEAILLQKHLEEAEKKKKQETEQVLSILKIDPSLIRGFLYNAKRTLKGVSQRYEANKDTNLNELLDFTFETIHNLKGNAVVIGLEIMSQKFHEVEEVIETLKGKQITGKDFLTILYEIDDADKMIEEMSTMLRKVADIYMKYPAGGHVVSNIMLIDNLERAVNVLSEKLDKPVDFFFKNEKNLVLPNENIDQFKDIVIQLIRNSVKHGIEPRSERLSLGKHIRGSITIELDKTDDNSLAIMYHDDGGGLNLEKIKERAIEQGLVTAYEAKKMKEEDVINLIYEKGLSTATKTDENAGRGQGMSLVKSLIEEMKGTFNTEFEKDKYFRLTIKLPINVTEDEIIDHEASNS